MRSYLSLNRDRRAHSMQWQIRLPYEKGFDLSADTAQHCLCCSIDMSDELQIMLLPRIKCCVNDGTYLLIVRR